VNQDTSIDKSVVVPTAVIAGSSRADDIHRRIYGAVGDTPAGNAPDAGGAGAQVDQTGSAAAPPPPDLPGVPDAPPIAPQVSASVAPEDADGATWMHRYNSMKGRYDKASRQIDDLITTQTELRGTIAALQAELGSLKSGGASGLPPVAGAKVTSLITEEEREAYGPEFLDVVSRRAREEVGAEVQELRDHVARLTNTLAGLSGKSEATAEQAMFSHLDDGCPNWRTINQDQTFIRWLQLPDTFSGVIRHELLQKAFERKDGPRVLAFFNGFLNDPEAGPSRPQPEPAGQRQPQIALEHLAAPGRARATAGAPPPVEKPIITRKDISAFYSDVARGAYRDRDEERKHREADIQAAIAEGRVR
jgi:hypothetical protein